MTRSEDWFAGWRAALQAVIESEDPLQFAVDHELDGAVSRETAPSPRVPIAALAHIPPPPPGHRRHIDRVTPLGQAPVLRCPICGRAGNEPHGL